MSKKKAQSKFRTNVYKIVQTIPAGKVLTYKHVAKKAGNKDASRAVGSALKYNPDPQSIPCHRVVGSDGSLCGYSLSGGTAKKRKILLKEGVVFNNDKVDVSSSLYTP